MPEPAALLELWRHESPRTLAAVGSFVDADLGYRPSASSQSVGELCAYVADSYRLTEYWLAHDTPPPEASRPTLTSVDRAAATVAECQQSLFAVLDALAPQRFHDVIAPFGVAEHRGVMALGMFKHDLHYRGELYALARVCGRQPPDLYA
jgi:uncharacterized damage-inducible protein DinB